MTLLIYGVDTHKQQSTLSGCRQLPDCCISHAEPVACHAIMRSYRTPRHFPSRCTHSVSWLRVVFQLSLAKVFCWVWSYVSLARCTAFSETCPVCFCCCLTSLWTALTCVLRQKPTQFCVEWYVCQPYLLISRMQDFVLNPNVKEWTCGSLYV